MWRGDLPASSFTVLLAHFLSSSINLSVCPNSAALIILASYDSGVQISSKAVIISG
jgi:hypothetical protein